MDSKVPYNHNPQREIENYLNHFMRGFDSHKTIYSFKEEVLNDLSYMSEKALVRELLFALVGVVKDMQDHRDE